MLVLFGLPAGSWYFLKYGADWRRAKLSTLDIKSNFVNAYDFTPEEKTELFALLSYKTSVISFGGSLNERENDLIDQYRKSYTFQWVTFVADSSQVDPVSSKNPRKYFVGKLPETDIAILRGVDYLLVDTAINIRQTYTGRTDETLSKLIEDIAIVLPRKKEKDISMKKSRNDQ